MSPVMAQSAPSDASPGYADLDLLLHLQVPVIVKLAGKKMNVDTITKIAVGTIIEFDKEAEDELELMIRDKIVGYGAAIKIGENFGLRITNTVDVRETIQALGDSE